MLEGVRGDESKHYDFTATKPVGENGRGTRLCERTMERTAPAGSGNSSEAPGDVVDGIRDWLAEGRSSKGNPDIGLAIQDIPVIHM